MGAGGTLQLDASSVGAGCDCGAGSLSALLQPSANASGNMHPGPKKRVGVIVTRVALSPRRRKLNVSLAASLMVGAACNRAHRSRWVNARSIESALL